MAEKFSGVDQFYHFYSMVVNIKLVITYISCLGSSLVGFYILPRLLMTSIISWRRRTLSSFMFCLIPPLLQLSEILQICQEDTNFVKIHSNLRSKHIVEHLSCVADWLLHLSKVNIQTLKCTFMTRKNLLSSKFTFMFS